jgi:hypothetical protein
MVCITSWFTSQRLISMHVCVMSKLFLSRSAEETQTCTHTCSWLRVSLTPYTHLNLNHHRLSQWHSPTLLPKREVRPYSCVTLTIQTSDSKKLPLVLHVCFPLLRPICQWRLPREFCSTSIEDSSQSPVSAGQSLFLAMCSGRSRGLGLLGGGNWQ